MNKLQELIDQLDICATVYFAEYYPYRGFYSQRKSYITELGVMFDPPENHVWYYRGIFHSVLIPKHQNMDGYVIEFATIPLKSNDEYHIINDKYYFPIKDIVLLGAKVPLPESWENK